MNDNCIFCKIANGVLPSINVYEDEKVLGLLDIHPISKGHTLLIPKTHHEWMQDVPDSLLAELFITTKKVMQAMVKGLPCDYVQVSVVGKDVPHFHIHLIPRYLQDGLPQYQVLEYENDKEKNNIAGKIKNYF